MCQLAEEIAEMKKLSKKLEVEENEKLIKKIRTKQHQALFYIEKVDNLSKQMRDGKGD